MLTLEDAAVTYLIKTLKQENMCHTIAVHLSQYFIGSWQKESEKKEAIIYLNQH